MCSKQELQNFLEEISENAKFPMFNFVSAEEFSVFIKCSVENNCSVSYYSEYCTEWIAFFSKFTKTRWIVRKCFPNLKRLVYRKVYVCHLSSHNKKKMADELSARNKECEAKIDFKMKFINRNTIKNDKSLKEGLNLHIIINFVHTHRVHVQESLDLLKCAMNTDEMFYKYFSDGHTAPTAKRYHELTLLTKYGDTNGEYLLNAEINPTLHHIKYLFKKKNEHINHRVGSSMVKKKDALEERGGALRYTDDYSIAVVITPYMKNVISGHSLDYIIIDSTPLKEIVVSFFLVPTQLGALPIACALHSQNTEPSYSQAFFSTKLLLENQTFRSFEPKKIMINVLDEQNHALDAIFTNKNLFISRASMIEEVWRLICENESKIEGTKRHTLMILFYLLLNANSVDEAETYYNQLDNNQEVECAPKLKESLRDIFKRRKEYIIQDESQVIDISIRTLKQFLLSKCFAHNNLIMIEVLMNILDYHWCQILQAHLKDQSIIETYTKFLNQDERVSNKLDIESSGNEFRLLNAKTQKLTTFRSDTMCCDCAKGRKGRLCEHLCAMLQSIVIKTSVPKEKRAYYAALAGEEEKDETPNLTCEDVSQDDIEMDQPMSNGPDEYYFVIKEELEENSDPLAGKDQPENTNNIENEMKTSYETALKALNDEFRRINKLFKDHPNKSNFNTMGRLARELSKIRPVEKLDLSNMEVEENNSITGTKE